MVSSCTLLVLVLQIPYRPYILRDTKLHPDFNEISRRTLCWHIYVQYQNANGGSVEGLCSFLFCCLACPLTLFFLIIPLVCSFGVLLTLNGVKPDPGVLTTLRFGVAFVAMLLLTPFFLERTVDFLRIFRHFSALAEFIEDTDVVFDRFWGNFAFDFEGIWVFSCFAFLSSGFCCVFGVDLEFWLWFFSVVLDISWLFGMTIWFVLDSGVVPADGNCSFFWICRKGLSFSLFVDKSDSENESPENSSGVLGSLKIKTYLSNADQQ